MGPVTKHLQTMLPGLPAAFKEGCKEWIFSDQVKRLGAPFYKLVLPLHPLLNLEYSILCNQLRDDFSNREKPYE